MTDFLLYTLTILWFAAAYAVKGGQLFYLFRNIDKARVDNKVLNRILDGKVLSTVMVIAYLCFVAVFFQIHIGLIPLLSLSILSIATAWILAVAPSMGEEYGAILNEGEYVKHKDDFGQLYGLKKGLQRGVWMGAMMCMATGLTAFLWASFAFMPLAAASLLIGRKFKFDGWAVSELLIGAVCFGLPMAAYIAGLL